MYASNGQPFDLARYEAMHIRDLHIYNRNKNDQTRKAPCVHEGHYQARPHGD